MTFLEQKQKERLNGMIELMGSDKTSIQNFVKESRSQIKEINQYIRQVHLADRLLNKYFGYLNSEEDRKEIIKIAQKFTEIRTARQIEVIFYILKGFSEKKLAEKMNVSNKTIKFHKTNIYRSLKVKSQAELMAYYYGAKFNDMTLPGGFNENT